MQMKFPKMIGTENAIGTLLSQATIERVIMMDWKVIADIVILLFGLQLGRMISAGNTRNVQA